MNIEELEFTISSLSREELRRFRLWFARYRADLRRKKPEIVPGRSGAPARDKSRRSEATSGAGVRHSRTDHFKICCRQLPPAIRKLVDRDLELLNKSSPVPALHLRKDGLIWSMNIGARHTALGLDDNDRVIWYWIGLRERRASPAAERAGAGPA